MTDINELVTWLRARRDDARTVAEEYQIQGDDEEAAEWRGRAEAFSEAVLHVTW